MLEIFKTDMNEEQQQKRKEIIRKTKIVLKNY